MDERLSNWQCPDCGSRAHLCSLCDDMAVKFIEDIFTTEGGTIYFCEDHAILVQAIETIQAVMETERYEMLSALANEEIGYELGEAMESFPEVGIYTPNPECEGHCHHWGM